MWKIYATESPTNFDNPFVIHILDFKESVGISSADFRNANNNELYINPDWAASTDGGRMSAYVSTISSGNLLEHTRINIVQRYVAEGTHIVQNRYIGNAIEWIWNGDDHSVYYLDFYEGSAQAIPPTSTLRFSTVPRDRFWLPYDPIPHQNMLSAYLVAIKDYQGKIGVCRVLWHADFSGIPAFNGQPEAIKDQWWFGKIIPNYLIKSYVDNLEEEDENAPLEPDTDPANPYESKATTSGFTWNNKFRITNWPWTTPDNVHLQWPNRYILDYGYYYDGVSFDEYMTYNDGNDSTNTYHYKNNEGRNLTGLRTLQERYNNHLSGQGSDLWVYDSTASTTGKFVRFNPTLDGSSANYSQFFNIPTKKIRLTGYDSRDKVNRWLEIDWTNQTYNDICRIKFACDDGSKFCADINYNPPLKVGAHIDLSNPAGFFLSPCIFKHASRYFLGGIFTYSGYSSLVILCQIDTLIPLSNYGGGNRGDPIDLRNDPVYSDYANGLNTHILDVVIRNDNGMVASPTTDSIANHAIGDAPDDENDGSPYNPDGTPRDPSKEITPGTGEKNTNPIDSTKVPNSHDGSLGNGTGDPHEGDEKIPDPVNTLPDDTHDPGTVSGSGVLSVFTPSQNELNNFTSEMLSNTVLDSIKNFFTTNPMDGIFGLHMLPYSGFAGSAIASPRIGTHTFESTMTLASTEYINVSYGTVYVPFIYDGYENYAPYSDAKIFLPFIGTKDIDINIIQGCQCTLKYNVSLVTGDIYAYLYAKWASKWGNGDSGKGVDHLVYSWQGNCAATIPLSHLDSTNYISGAMQIAGGITSLTAGLATGNPTTIPAGVSGITTGVAEIGRTSIVSSGNISGMAAFMGERTPFFIFSRPIIAFNKSYNHYVGQRSNAICLIGNLTSGTFTMMSNIDLTGIPATDEELSEIDSILKGGFYI